MMRTWSDWPMPSAVQLDTVSTHATVISQNGGESSEIYEIGDFPGWLAKLYKTTPSAGRVQALDQLITLPQKMNDQDMLLVDTSIAWPVSRITDGDRTVGIVLAKAPDNFWLFEVNRDAAFAR